MHPGQIGKSEMEYIIKKIIPAHDLRVNKDEVLLLEGGCGCG